jgi:hypothetical protein
MASSRSAGPVNPIHLGPKLCAGLWKHLNAHRYPFKMAVPTQGGRDLIVVPSSLKVRSADVTRTALESECELQSSPCFSKVSDWENADLAFPACKQVQDALEDCLTVSQKQQPGSLCTCPSNSQIVVANVDWVWSCQKVIRNQTSRCQVENNVDGCSRKIVGLIQCCIVAKQ